MLRVWTPSLGSLARLARAFGFVRGTNETLPHHGSSSRRPDLTLRKLHVRVTRELTESVLHPHMRLAAPRLAAPLRAQRRLLLGPRQLELRPLVLQRTRLL